MKVESKKLTLFLLGNSIVGKTSFIKRYVKDEFEENMFQTCGIDSFSKSITLENGEEINLLFYDTAGQEQYRAISFNLIKGTDGIFLVYDITDRQSFVDINRWIESILDIKGEDFPIILIGNKIDLKEKRVVSEEEGKKLADDNRYAFIETSCKDGTNIEESVKILIPKILEYKKEQKNNKVENGKPSTKLSKKKQKEKKKKCCG